MTQMRFLFVVLKSSTVLTLQINFQEIGQK